MESTMMDSNKRPDTMPRINNLDLANQFIDEQVAAVRQQVGDKKVLLAHRKIRHGRKPTEIYLECGFSNYPSFYRAYVSYFGHSPREQKV